jgi:hypothetical protein
MPFTRSILRRSAASLLCVAAVVVCACSKQDAKSDSSTVAQAGAPAANAKFDPTTRVAVVHAKDFAFDAPDTVTAGWTTFHLVNDGPNLHHVSLVRIDSGKTVADFQTAMKVQGPPPAWIVEAGGPNAPSPGGSVDATLNLAPGTYMILCFVDIPGGVPHFMKGMTRPLTVLPATAATGTEPTADVTVDLADYAFTPAATITGGKHTFKVVNKGPQVHELELIRLAPGKTIKDLGAWMAKPEGPPPADALGGISGMHAGMAQYFTADLTPGNYVMICFVPDAKDNKPHMQHGMVKEFAVK